MLVYVGLFEFKVLTLEFVFSYIRPSHYDQS